MSTYLKNPGRPSAFIICKVCLGRTSIYFFLHELADNFIFTGFQLKEQRTLLGLLPLKGNIPQLWLGNILQNRRQHLVLTPPTPAGCTRFVVTLSLSLCLCKLSNTAISSAAEHLTWCLVGEQHVPEDCSLWPVW